MALPSIELCYAEQQVSRLLGEVKRLRETLEVIAETICTMPDCAHETWDGCPVAIAKDALSEAIDDSH